MAQHLILIEEKKIGIKIFTFFQNLVFNVLEKSEKEFSPDIICESLLRVYKSRTIMILFGAKTPCLIALYLE